MCKKTVCLQHLHIDKELIQKFHSDVNQNGEYDDTDNQENQLV